MVGAAIAYSLPYALGAAASPLPITAVVLMLLSTRGAPPALAFALGRLFVYALIIALVTITSELIGRGLHSDLQFASLIAQLVAGVATLGVGIWTFPRGRRSTATNGLWERVRTLDRIAPVRAAGVGMVLALGPGNLILLLGGGLAIAGQVASPAAGAVAAVVFLAIACSTVLVPIFLVYVAGPRAVETLKPLEAWLGTHGPTLSAAALVVIGIVLIVTSLPRLL